MAKEIANRPVSGLEGDSCTQPETFKKNMEQGPSPAEIEQPGAAIPHLFIVASTRYLVRREFFRGGKVLR